MAARARRPPDAALDDVEPAATPITLRHLLANTSGYGVQVDPELHALMRTDRVPSSAKTDDSFFPGFREGTGWGFGVAVQTEGEHAGRYGWSCGQGTDFWIDPDGSFRIVLSQVEMGPEVMGLFTDV